MPKRYWLPALTVIGLAILAFLGLQLKEWHDKREDAYRAAQEQYEHTKGDLAPGVATDGKTSEPDPKSYRDEWREEHDLKAQRDMAEWAFIMLLISGGSAIVTAIGVVYVALTLEATRDAVKETAVAAQATREAAEIARKEFIASHRPKMRVRYIWGPFIAAYECPNAFITFVNVGEADAIIVNVTKTVNHRMGASGWYSEMFAPVFEIEAKPVVQSGATYRIEAQAFFPLSPVTVGEIKRGQRELFIAGRILYDDPLGVRRETGFFRAYDPHQERFVKKPSTDADTQEFEYED